ncbi:MAG TPA: ABC transporter ATP-binding protein [Phycisphaerales bacterium]|nr:ABC transporter ATP-binding protein [Phycisphaerales bacterium]
MAHPAGSGSTSTNGGSSGSPAPKPAAAGDGLSQKPSESRSVMPSGAALSSRPSRVMFREYLERRRRDLRENSDRRRERRARRRAARQAGAAADGDRSTTSGARFVYGGAKLEGGDADRFSKARRQRSRSFWTLARALWAMLRGHHGVVYFGIITVALQALGGLALPGSTKVALDYILTDNPGPSALPEWIGTHDRLTLLWMLGGAITFVNIASLLIGVAGRWQMTRLTQRLRVSLRRRVFQHAVRLPLPRVYALKTGGAASLLREDTDLSSQLLFGVLYNPFRALVQLLGTLVILATVDWRLLAGSLVLLPVVYASQKTWISRIRPVVRETHQTRMTIDAGSTEVFGGMRVVRGFAREQKEAARFSRANHLLARMEMLVWWWSRAIELAWYIVIPLASVGVLLYGGSRVISGTLTIGDVMMFSAYLLMLLGPLEALSQAATGIQSQLAALDRILDLLDEPTEFSAPSPGERSGNGALPPLRVRLRPSQVRGRVEMLGVGFTYPNAHEPVLRDISLVMEPGQTVALVGPSGAGKTTLCNLVARFYDPTVGRIELDGRDVRDIDVRSYRSLLGIVEQDVFLFDGSVRENIAYGRRAVTDAQISAAARAANAEEFITRLEKGYHTLIGERGVRLSGGQKQRLAIARAILADPRILILDEATSNLDTLSEQLIQQSLSVLMKGRTSLVIAHRLSTIRTASLIVVLEHGRVIETGTHDALMSRSGAYAEMVRRQTERPADANAPAVLAEQA